MAFYTLEPWGTEVEDFRAGMISSVIANTSRDPKKKRQPFQAADFMPLERSIEETAQDQPDLLRSKIDAVMLAFGGKEAKV